VILEELFERNQVAPDAAVLSALGEWCEFDGQHGKWPWSECCNTKPWRLAALLQKEALPDLSVDLLAEVVWLTHDFREHARQVKM